MELIELNDDNYEALSRLRLLPYQEAYVKNFNKCVEYKKENPFLRIFGIKDNDTYIGLTAFARWDSNLNIPENERWCWFDEFFFDYKYQHKGYSHEAIRLILAKMKELYNPPFVVLSVRNDNLAAKSLYEDLGFIYTGEIYDEALDQVLKREIRETDELIMRKYY